MLSARREKCEEDLESYWKGVCQSLFELLILHGRPKNPRFLLPLSVVLNAYDRDSSERVSYRNSAISRVNPWLGTQDTHVHACVLRIVPEIVLSAHPMYLYPTPFDQLPRRIPLDAIQNTFIITKKVPFPFESSLRRQSGWLFELWMTCIKIWHYDGLRHVYICAFRSQWNINPVNANETTY